MKSIGHLACSLLLCFAGVAGSQTPSQHQELLNTLDLSERDREVSERIIWVQSALIPNCRKNFEPAACDSLVFQYIQAPFTRDEATYVIDTTFLSHSLKNLLGSSTFESEHFSVHKRCDESALIALDKWRKSIDGTDFENAVFVTFLSPDEPWFFCFHRDRWQASLALDESSQFDLEYREFWLWHAGKVVGQVECGTLYRRRSDARRFPQCKFKLNFLNGEVQMEIGPFPAASLRDAMFSIDLMTSKFWRSIERDLRVYGVQKELFYREVLLDPEAGVAMTAIDAETR
ncbi:hypothetical protein VXL47_17505 [Phaeobacter sp. JH20_30]|uniref:hypothetical protein n=1 Tax=unclassified Phaeobacter TaxID=2621772 RepID=UPI003A8C5E5F